MREIRNDFIYVYVRNQRPKMENRSHSGDFLFFPCICRKNLLPLQPILKFIYNNYI